MGDPKPNAPAESQESPDIRSLYGRPLPASRHGALFNAFSYPTKISPETIALFIATHTAPGDKVVDVFGGSGTTGVAAKLCGSPTEAMRQSAEALGLRPRWGERSAAIYEIGVLGSLVSRVMCNPPDPDEFAAAAASLLDMAEQSHGWLYQAVDDAGEDGTVRYTIWSDVLVCPACGAETTYWDAAVRREPLRMSDRFDCKSCDSHLKIDACDRKSHERYDRLVDSRISEKVRVPVSVYGRTGSRLWTRPAGATDSVSAVDTFEATSPSAPIRELEWGDLFRSGYHAGITHLHHMYTARNFAAVSRLWELIEAFPSEMREPLRVLVLSFNSAHSTLMTRVVVKRGRSDFVLTGAQSGVLYISGLPVEKNVFDGVRRKIRTFEQAFALVAESPSQVEVFNQSSTRVNEQTESVAYVFTDPPFGDYIPYAELNQVNELWLESNTNRDQEIIISRSAGKDATRYGDLLADVFHEVARILEPRGRATVVFHSAHASVWEALTRAYTAAGLTVRRTSVLDKTQPSFKQAVSTLKVRGDPVILLDRAPSRTSSVSIDELIASVRHRTDPEAQGHPTREELFSQFVALCLGEGLPVIGAAEFYARAKLSARESVR